MTEDTFIALGMTLGGVIVLVALIITLYMSSVNEDKLSLERIKQGQCEIRQNGYRIWVPCEKGKK